MQANELDLGCKKCKGEGSITCDCNCPHCEYECGCYECEGTGFNLGLVDIDRWAVAANAFRAKVLPVFILRGKNNAVIGLRSCFVYRKGVAKEPKHVLLAKDYLINKDETSE